MSPCDFCFVQHERSTHMSAVMVLLVVALILWFLAAIPLPWANPV